MERKRPLINALLCGVLFLSSLAMLGAGAGGCNSAPKLLQIDPCGVYWDEFAEPDGSKKWHLAAWCVPLNQPGKAEYQRWVKPQDWVITSEEYAKTQKYYNDMAKDYAEALRKCAERCK